MNTCHCGSTSGTADCKSRVRGGLALRNFLGLPLLIVLVVLANQVTSNAAGKEKTRPVSVTKGEDQLDVAIDGKPFFTYQYQTQAKELRRPVIHPLRGPGGEVLTQLGEVPGKRTAHYWHTGLWIAHQNFTRGNNWQMDADPRASPRKFSSLRHRGFDRIGSGATGRFVERLEWDDVKGEAVLFAETRTVTVPHRPAGRRVIDFDLVLRAGKEQVTLGATPYQLLALRLVNPLVPAFSKDAAITNSEGQTNPRGGAPAKWIDVSGKLGGGAVGVSLFNHPANFRHPTPCLNFANQTVGLSPTHREPHTLKPNESLRLRFRVLVHAGTPAEAKVAEEYEAYCKEGPKDAGVSAPADR